MATTTLLRFLLISAIFSLLASCAGTEYVRVPSVCPRDPYCLSENSATSPDAKAREREFARRVMASTVDVRIIRYVPNKGRVITHMVGMLISAKGYVLTAHADFQGAEAITVSLRTPRTSDGYDAGRDMLALPLTVDVPSCMALLVIENPGSLPPAFPIRYDPVLARDPVWFYGARTALMSGSVVETSIVEGRRTDFADADIDAEAADAGAPILNICGEIVGIAVGPYGKHGRLRFVPVTIALDRLQISLSELR